ncbi:MULTISPECIES: alpha/beta fold hydrolase [Paraburkholderia]|uniref:alpha/beta fold hydrolase n=1 Tax=Paraburkholderia TaxID=1822464 RepID=UPI0038B7B0F9
MSVDIQHHNAVINGFDMHYAACGQPGRPLLLFVHGFPECWSAWRAQLKAFGEHYFAVALDTRGINESSGPDAVSGYRAGHMVRDMAALIERLGYQQCVAIGHDWGGAIACAFALAQPERLRALVMINAVHPGVYRRELVENPVQQAASAYMNSFTSEGAVERIRADDCAYLLDMFSDNGALPSWLDGATRQSYQQAWSKAGSVEAGINYYRASALHPATPEDPGASAVFFNDADLQVQVPTLILWGEQDRFLLRGCLDGVEQYFPQLRVERIQEGSHWVIHEFPHKINNHLAAFLNELSDGD